VPSSEPIEIPEQAKHLAREVIARDLPGLQFDPLLEQRFEHYYGYHYLRLNRIYLLVGALVLAILTLVDQLIIPAMIEDTLMLRAPVLCFIALIFLLSHITALVPWFQLLLCIAAISIHLSLLTVASVTAASTDQLHYQSGTLISVIFACMVLKLQFHYVLPLALFMWFAQVLGMHFFVVQAFGDFIEMMVITTLILIMAIVVCFRAESEVRRSFLLQLLLPSPPHPRSHLATAFSQSPTPEKPEPQQAAAETSASGHALIIANPADRSGTAIDKAETTPADKNSQHKENPEKYSNRVVAVSFNKSDSS